MLDIETVCFFENIMKCIIFESDKSLFLYDYIENSNIYSQTDNIKIILKNRF